MVSESRVRVKVIYSPQPRQVQEISLVLSAPCCVLQALQCSGFLLQFPEIDTPQILLGIWGRKARLDQVLRDLDRVEIYRPLRVDPKVARRERFTRQGARAAGLFRQKRPGAKAGY
ncbi:MAG: RnfH family protein [Rhodoferax sp.]|nr:RnfH family protein [Rhodoferax sp.]OGB41291.1 MAG: protein rnfH [Burkholderiales bacterium RIFOXYC2_FULL_59_8]OGB56610.1 MAG: protein rnfH [Burkholderiales bacterium RIFOXYD12_FULL_59_19]OGB82322.1 MAG: protein rnfH [Burkholderiales bacterium RIFOXYD2_FULL_59_8]OGB82420.1 MAG: protein rnfH [Burkholderiales bacterium RIFOXYC12_FULL_60_6]MDO8317605.1 RnfH family protein [Rhodoferax sp.]